MESNVCGEGVSSATCATERVRVRQRGDDGQPQSEEPAAVEGSAKGKTPSESDESAETRSAGEARRGKTARGPEKDKKRQMKAARAAKYEEREIDVA